MRNKIDISFTDAREIARKLGLKSCTQWFQHCKSNRSSRLPYHPQIKYKEEWKGWADFLGPSYTSSIIKVSYHVAQQYAKYNKIKSKREWMRLVQTKNPNSMPHNPHLTYAKKGWTSWADFLGTKKVYKKPYPPFQRARKFIRAQKLSGYKEYQSFIRKHPELYLPSHPFSVYKDNGWLDWYDWLGMTRSASLKPVSYYDACQYARKQGIKTQKEWLHHIKTQAVPPRIPKHPNNTYKYKGWVSWHFFLVPNKKNILSLRTHPKSG